MAASHAQRVKINFIPESDKFAASSVEYQELWKAEGDRIVASMERVSGLKFKETGHRHISQLEKRPEGIDEHSVLFLILYDIWVDLYGNKFADEQVEVEKKRRGPYPAAWTYALSMTREERKKKFAEFVALNP